MIAVGALLLLVAYAWWDCASQTGRFRALARNGLPDVSHGRYVRLNHTGAYRSWPESSSGGAPMVGNAWLMEEYPEGESRFVINGCESIILYDSRVLERLRRAAGDVSKHETLWFERRPYHDGRDGGEWVDANLSMDLTNTVALLAQIQTKSILIVIRDAIVRLMNLGAPGGGYDPDAAKIRQRARMLLFAANAANVGYREQASAIVALLDGQGDCSAVMGSAINQIADAKYVELCRDLEKTRDKAAFAEGLRRLVKRYGRKWEHLAAMEKQLVSMQRPPPIATSMTQGEQAFLAAIDSRPIPITHYGYWILPQRDGDPTVYGELLPEIQNLLRKRFAAMPFLMSLLDDYTPTSTPLFGYASAGSHGERYADAILMRDVERSGDLLDRPATRAEIARGILASTIWENEVEAKTSYEVESYSKDPFACFKTKVSGWYERHKTMTDLDLVREFVGIAWTPPAPAMRFMVEKGDVSDIRALEDKLYASTLVDEFSAFEDLLPYVQLREKAALPFLDRYSAALLAHVEQGLDRNLQGADGPSGDRLRSNASASKGRRNRLVEDLRAIARGDLTTEGILDELTSGKTKWNDVCRTYWFALSLEPYDVGVERALKAAMKVDDCRLRESIVHSAVMNKFRKTGGGVDLATAQASPVIESHLLLWRDLLRDTDRRWTNITVTSRLAVEMERLYGDAIDSAEDKSRISAVGVEFAAVFLRRAWDRIEGKKPSELTHLPSADMLSPTDRVVLKTRLMGSCDDRMDAAIAGLNLDERLYLAEELDRDAVLNARLVPYANRIVSVTLNGKDDPELLESLLVFKGKRLSTNIVWSVIDLCTREVERGRFVSARIDRGPHLRGISMELRSEGPKPIDVQCGSYSYESYIKVWATPGDSPQRFTMWFVTVPTDVIAAVRKIRFFDDQGREIRVGGCSHSRWSGAYDSVQKKEFAKALSHLLSTEVNATRSQSVTVEGEVGKDK